MNFPSDKKLSKRLDDLVQEAVDKAVEAQRQKGEYIAVSDEQGKVRIIPTEEIFEFKRSLDSQELAG